MHRYKTWNGAMPTTAQQAETSTGTALKTHLQIATPSTRQIQLISWGFSLNLIPNALPVEFELLQTDVAATVTAHVAAGVQPLDPNAPASLMTLGVSATGYNASVEGATTATRMFDAGHLVVLGSGGGGYLPYSYQWMPDERPIVAVSKFLRFRIKTGQTAGCLAWIVWDE